VAGLHSELTSQIRRMSNRVRESSGRRCDIETPARLPQGNATGVPPGGMVGEVMGSFENKTDLTALEFIFFGAHIGFKYGGAGMPLKGSIPKAGTFFWSAPQK
jgi:hypothetical protein